ncbi:uncharacterized protein [Procambarus clarkii]|uniref:uncharacterized protein isoform X1 n=1 Tax=Procambarus clarkii TaxID=6728 RepID=UPI0037437884
MQTSIDPELNLLSTIYDNYHFNDLNCRYFAAHDLNNVLTHNHNISVINLNVRSLGKHFDDVSALIEAIDNKFSFIILTETWLKEDTIQLFNMPNYSAIHNCRQLQRGGGTALYYHQELTCLKEIRTRDCYGEYIFASFRVKGAESVLTVGAVYRIPNTDVSEFNSNLRNLILDNRLNKNHLIIAGDFNIDLCEPEHPTAVSFLNCMNSCFLLPLITRPTRITDSTATTLDHIWTNITSPLTSGIITDCTTDHYPTFLLTNISKPPLESRVIRFRLHNETAIDNFITAADNVNWESELGNIVDINLAVQSFLQKTLSLYNTHCPMLTKQVTTKRLNNPWLTKGILKSINKKHDLEKKYRLGIVSKEFSKNYSLLLSKIIRRAKTKYYEDKFTQIKSNIKQTWRTISQILGSKKSLNNKPTLLSNNDGQLSASDSAIEFNRFFSSIGSSLANDIPSSSTDINDYLSGNYPQSLYLKPINSTDVNEIILSLKNQVWCP